jgi:transcriptional regulator with XRE-family HTH domain
MVVKAEERRWGRTRLLRHGSLLRAARERSEKSAKDICMQCGISAAQLSDIERGIGPLSLRRANQIAKALGQSFAEIVQAVLQDRVDEAGFDLIVSVSDSSSARESCGARFCEICKSPDVTSR